MIRAFLRFVEWLDRRWPPKVTVTEEIFEGLTARFRAQEKSLASLRTQTDEAQLRVVALEKSLAAVKEAISKGSVSLALDKRRADFIATGRMGDGLGLEQHMGEIPK